MNWAHPHSDPMADIARAWKALAKMNGHPDDGTFILLKGMYGGQPIRYRCRLVNGRVVILDPPGTIQNPTDPSPRPRRVNARKG